MNIAFLTSDFYPKNVGGAGISSKLITDELRRQGMNVDVYALNGEERNNILEFEDHYRLPAGDIYSIPNPMGKPYEIPNPIGENISTARFARTLDRYDILHIYNARQIPAAILTTDIPIVSTINNFMWVCSDEGRYLKEGCPEYSLFTAFNYAHSAGFQGVSMLLRTIIEFIGKSLVKQSDVITVQTGGMESVLTKCGYSDCNIRVVPNVLDPSFSNQDFSKSNKIIYVGRLREEKGPEEAVMGYRELPRRIKRKWNFEIYGDGPKEDFIRGIISDENCGNISLEYSSYEDLPKTYAEADLLIHPSKYPEPFSRTWLEAMATRTPILCSNNPSSRSILNGVAKFYDPLSIIDLSQSLQSLLESEDRRHEMSIKGEKHVQKYRSEKVVPQYISSYKEFK